MAIFNDQPAPLELVGHSYQKLFHLTYSQLQEEPMDHIIMAMLIEKLLQEKQENEIKARERNMNG